jgi:membrane protease YdiL (CAAX protease family)
MLAWAIVGVGTAAVVAAWVLVRRRVLSVWVAAGVAVGLAAIASLATGRVHLAERFGTGWAALVGVGGGVLLYLATAAFVLIVRRAPVFDRHVAEIYDQRRGLSLGLAFVLAALVAAPGEEIFWRGLVQGQFRSAAGAGVGALLAWGLYVAANVPSGSLAILAGAVVGGAAWAALAWWSGGVLASLLCHGVWTGLMLLLPPGGAAATTSERA